MKLLDALIVEHADADAMLVCNASDILYLTGVREGISWLIVSRNGTIAVSRHMLIHEVRQQAFDCEVLLPSANSTDRFEMEEFVVAELQRRSLAIVLLETSRIVASTYLRLASHAAKAGVALLESQRITERLRAIKDPGELHAIRRCVEIAERSMLELLHGGAAGLLGKSERELAVELEQIMIAFGADRQGFPETGIIVASGPNSASAHHVPGSRKIATGEALLIDWGAELGSYRSDLTRTFFIGEPPSFALDAYPVVERALAKAAALLKEGELMGDVDHAAREAVLSSGFPEFHYGVGHGVGLNIHEAPWIRAHSEERLQAGMVTTLEPGIYLPGIGGIRIEKLFHITAEGAGSLDKLPVSFEDMVLR